MDYRTSPLRRALTNRLVAVYENPISLIIVFFGVFYFLLFLTLIGRSPATLLLADFLIAILVVMSAWVVTVGVVISWQGVLISADRMKGVRSPREAIRTHFDIILSYLRLKLTEDDADLLAIRSHLLLTSPDEAQRYVTTLATDSLALDLIEKTVYSSKTDVEAYFDSYVKELQDGFSRLPGPEAAVLDFVAKRFDHLEHRFRVHARRWRPKPTFWETVEQHSVLVTMVVALSFLALGLLFGVVYHSSFSFTPP